MLIHQPNQPSSPSSPPTDLPTLCSTHDNGGGVLSTSTSTSESTFIIYTATTLPPSLHSLIANPPPGLSELASAIAQSVPIHLTISTLDGQLSTLPCPGRGGKCSSSNSEVDQLPWFFLNAARCSKFAIAGRGSVLETLLSVLRRPWCALELCCAAPPDGLDAIVGFTSYVARLGFAGYDAATILFAHELISRDQEQEVSVRQGRDPVVRWSVPDRIFIGQRQKRRSVHHSFFTYTPLADLREMCTAVFGGSMRSYNGFWLRLISVVGLELGVRYSRIGVLLGGGDDENEDVDLLSASIAKHWDGKFQMRYRPVQRSCGDETGWGLRRSVSVREFSSRIDEEGDGARKDGLRAIGSKEFLVWVYAQVLGRLGDAEV